MLPIYELEREIVAKLKETRRVVISAPTGSGKSTQVPQMLLKHGLLRGGQVVVLQPRRLAARMLAARVAGELGTALGREVGYQVRFESVISSQTKIRFVTEGILLRQMIDDPKLAGVAAVIFDEFHERHLYGDVTLARALEVPGLMIVVMSATLDCEALAEYLKPCAVLESKGRVFPVEIVYAGDGAERPVWERAAEAFEEYRDEGDALIFMPGAYEISRTIESLRKTPGRIVLPLHGELPPKDQDAAVARYDRPKVIVSTNVAETSITIEGVRLVIDSGLARMARYDPYRGINTLLVEKISRASADQRAGRAGRAGPGRCVRLWSEREHLRRPLRETPEVKRLDLSEVVLTLKAAGVEDLKAFRWLEPPEERALADAEELLHDLGALKQGRITEMGRRMLAFAVHPRYARMLVAAQEMGCVFEASVIAALTQGRNLRVRGGERGTSDFFALMGGEDRRLVEQFMRVAGSASRGAPEEAVRKCILIGFNDRVARMDPATLRCDLVHGRRGVLARESVVRSPLLVAAEVREVEGRKRETILSLATAIEATWLKELFPEDMGRRRQVHYDPGARRVVAEEQVLFRDLVLERRPVEPPAEEAARLLAEEVLGGRLKLSEWDDSVEQWIARVNWLAKVCPELDLAPIGREERRLIVEQLCYGGFGYKDIKDRPAREAVRGWLSAAKQQLVEQHAPERLELANGRRPKVVYGADGQPYIQARIQDLYDVSEVPRIAMGRVRPVVHILAPNYRPVQITHDLAGFWREHYPRIRKELQRKYPKHEWRDV